MILLISSFEIISVFIPYPNIFLLIAASLADDDAVNPNEINTILVNGLSTFLIKDNPGFSDGSKILPKNHLDSSI